MFNWIKKLFSKKRKSQIIDINDSNEFHNKITERIAYRYKLEGCYEICRHCENWKCIDKEIDLGYCTNKDNKKFITNTKKITGCSEFQGTENYKRLVKAIDNALGVTNELRNFFRSIPNESD